jgi:lipopolysaccharide/colanic/teichoic acid biosynthesis glycosyltransferase
MFVCSGGEPLKITVMGDPRITRVGRCLRATKLDELPQLFNVFRGDMSLVGPRPEVPEYVARYSSTQKKLLEFKPGITGAASLGYIREDELLAGKQDPDRFYRQYILPHKVELDLAYCAQATLMNDVRLLVQTICRIFLPTKNSVSSV